MRRFSIGMLCAQIAFLLFVVCLSVYAVIGTVATSFHLSFVETAERTDLVLSLISFLLVIAISIFVAYIMHRRRKSAVDCQKELSH